jgi:hypothetical protein
VISCSAGSKYLAIGALSLKHAISKVQWWLMWGDFPNLNWARLRVYGDGSADVFDMDGRTYQFATEEEARNDLLEDEYGELSTLDADDEKELGISRSSLSPPVGEIDEVLLPQMYKKRE